MISIRHATDADSAAARSLIESVMVGEFQMTNGMAASPDLVKLSDSYGGKRDLFMVAEKDGEIIGTVAIKEDSQEVALLRRIFIHKDHRGKGYGDSLLSEALDYCAEQGYQTVMFRGTDQMKTAIRLCSSRGFEEDDVAVIGDMTMVIMSKTL